MPLVTQITLPFFQFTGKVGRQFETPLANTFIRDFNAPASQDLFNISEAQGEAMIQPDGMANSLSGKSETFVGFHARELYISAIS